MASDDEKIKTNPAPKNEAPFRLTNSIQCSMIRSFAIESAK